MIYEGRCIIDCGDTGHQHVTMLKMIPAGTLLYTHAQPSEPKAEPAHDDLTIAYMSGFHDGKKAKSEPAPEPLTGCACRWDAESNRVATCVIHQGWLDVVGEWADRAKAAEAATPQARKPLTHDDVRKAGGIVHRDGNIFFTNINMLNGIEGGAK